jgi:AbrB family looped-hinge helix DNA binding protein
MKNSIYKKGLGVICGTAVLGARGQVVIPKEARERLKAKEGDRFLFVEHFGKIVIIPEKEMRKLINDITKHLNIK